VKLVHSSVNRVDIFSLNRLILSTDASDSEAAISWAAARPSVNETARLVRLFGYELQFSALPLCVYEGDNAEFVRSRISISRRSGHRAVNAGNLKYLDPNVAAGGGVGALEAQLALPKPCRMCDYLAFCGRVEEWYVDLYGHEGLRPVPLTPIVDALAQ
jgi:hypothetical protein